MDYETKRQRNIDTCKQWRQEKKEREERIEKDLEREMIRNVELQVQNKELWEKKERLERERKDRCSSGNDYYGNGGLWG